MANLEKIIRPHLPANIAPVDTTAKDHTAPNNTVVQFGKAGNQVAGGRSASMSFAWSHAYSKYMTGQEREVKGT